MAEPASDRTTKLVVVLGVLFVAYFLIVRDDSGSAPAPPRAIAQAAAKPTQAALATRPRPAPVPAEAVGLETLLGEFKDNEIRADGRFKGKRVQVMGLVGDVKKDVLGGIYVTVGTGADFEIPMVQCFFDERFASVVAALSRGQRVTVQGRVDGLMMNVLVKDCELQQ